MTYTNIQQTCKNILDEIDSFEHHYRAQNRNPLTISELHIVRDDNGNAIEIKAVMFGTSDQT